MIELIIGALLGTIGSLFITHIYYKKSSNDFKRLKSNLKEEIDKLEELSKDIEKASQFILSDTAVIRKYATLNTVDDPEYPYK